jgi:putative colanic acid biosynthesis acetyltransferase WcaF
METKQQATRSTSPWSARTRARVILWYAVWLLLFRPCPKPFKNWRNMLLRLFGATITGSPFVASSAVIRMPWLLTLEDRACIGPHTEVYNLARVTLKRRSVVAQHCYLCAGTHDITDPELPLVVGPIVIGEEAFVGAKALILPGVVVNVGAVIGAGSVVTKDVPSWTICAGNPCKPIRPREFAETSTNRKVDKSTG